MILNEIDKNQIIKYSCGHVVPKENIMMVSVNKGFDETLLDFRYEIRNSKALLNQLSETIISLSKIIPHGNITLLLY